MDQILVRVLSFDRFELDQTRGCARVGGRAVDLRPKAFDLLCYLAENAGRLVSKQELHDAVWGRVTVSDDALVQCIRELRQKLGDEDRTLIRTVARRGYLLDAERRTPEVAPVAAVPVAIARPPAPTPTADLPWYRREPGRWAAAVLVVVLTLGSIPLARTIHAPPPDLVSPAEAQHLAQLATDKNLRVPAFHITSLAQDVPDSIRRFVGVWVSDKGWGGSDRQFMLIVTSVTRLGEVRGYLVNGPATPYSRVQGPGYIKDFKGYVSAGALRHDAQAGMWIGTPNSSGDMDLKFLFKDGVIDRITLKPVWTLPKLPGANSVASLQ
ncbi:MAG: winged helix-turn-helix domain-containing protein [Alphaproteobacteria bacterium]|nr:winged helix-turn-helix domain-containing protein [Alphaproteobacteria bacterium]